MILKNEFKSIKCQLNLYDVLQNKSIHGNIQFKIFNLILNTKCNTIAKTVY